MVAGLRTDAWLSGESKEAYREKSLVELLGVVPR